MTDFEKMAARLARRHEYVKEEFLKMALTKSGHQYETDFSKALLLVCDGINAMSAYWGDEHMLSLKWKDVLAQEPGYEVSEKPLLKVGEPVVMSLRRQEPPGPWNGYSEDQNVVESHQVSAYRTTKALSAPASDSSGS